MNQYKDRAMAAEGLVMVGSHDYRLVVVSVLISVLAAYAARDLSKRVRDARGRSWLTRLVFGATADGMSTWSMHFTAMLAFRLLVPVQYDWPSRNGRSGSGNRWRVKEKPSRRP
jgi:NO-binding membrane sensor protein with MHYT domain